MEELEQLNKQEQQIGIGLSLALIVEIIAPAYLIYYLLSNQCADTLYSWRMQFIVACLGGFLGGSTRSLYKLMYQLNRKGYKTRLSRWFLYLVKPFVGIGVGLVFFIATYTGFLSGIFEGDLKINPLGMVLISFLGGMFFEDVFNSLQKRISGT